MNSTSVSSRPTVQDEDENFEPTPAEAELLNLYKLVGIYERERDRRKEEAAKAKLRASDEQFQRERAKGDAALDSIPSEFKPKSKRPRVSVGNHDEYGDDVDGEDDSVASDDDDENDDDDFENTKKSNVESEDDAITKQLEEEEAAAAKELERQKHLTVAGGEEMQTMMETVTVRRKAVEHVPTSQSLLSSLEVQSTPPHEFSDRLDLPKSGLSGNIIFPNNMSSENWSPPQDADSPTDGDLSLELDDFDLSQARHGMGNNTLAIKFTAERESKRFSLNIAGPSHNDYSDIYFHFNPRQKQKGGQLVINDKQDGIWGQGLNIPLSVLPLIFGRASCTLMIQIHGDGYDVFLDGKHCARLEHRLPLPDRKCNLILQFPSTDDYNSPERWTVHRVWWGHKKILVAPTEMSNSSGLNSTVQFHPKKLFIKNLSKIYSDIDVERRKAKLERAFRKYGGAQGVTVVANTGCAFAFVEVETERKAELAMKDEKLLSHYTINRAHLTQKEQREAERAAKNAAAAAEESNKWD